MPVIRLRSTVLECGTRLQGQQLFDKANSGGVHIVKWPNTPVRMGLANPEYGRWGFESFYDYRAARNRQSGPGVGENGSGP